MSSCRWARVKTSAARSGGHSARSGTLLRQYTCGDTVCALAFSPGNEFLASGGNDNRLTLRRTLTGHAVMRELQQTSPHFAFTDARLAPVRLTA